MFSIVYRNCCIEASRFAYGNTTLAGGPFQSNWIAFLVHIPVSIRHISIFNAM
ncbi:hypothetical protein HanPSC8_Chr05g0226041 [Helianthus annuus]|nr:hypothetical protein HanPSC8_Chr05g0226041 [Helianthus annuus]